MSSTGRPSRRTTYGVVPHRLVLSLPLELVELLVDDPDAFFSSGVGPVGLKLLRALRLLRLLRLLKVLKMKRYIQLLEDATQINLRSSRSSSS